MSSVLNFTGDFPSISLKSRPTRIGPEWDLVKDFSEYIVDLFKSQGKELAVFYEPALASGFPDIVIAEFSKKAYSNWSEARFDLKPSDLKILNHIYGEKSLRLEDLTQKLGCPLKEAVKIIARLSDAELIYVENTSIKARKHTSVFGIKRLIALEAKMNNWQTAFQQALTNKWFASEVYILSPVLTPSNKIVEQAERNGIGIYTFTGIVNKVCEAEQRQLPECYAVWLFNEWIGRRLNQQANVSNRPSAIKSGTPRVIKPQSY
jgi:predicted transcriptional regulator